MIVLTLGGSTPALCQRIFIDPPQIPLSAEDKKIADWTSTAITGTTLAVGAWDTWHQWQDPALRKIYLFRYGLHVGITLLASEGLKRTVHRFRPDGSDNKSFPAEHVALTAVATCSIRQKSIGLSFTIGTGAGRMLGGKNYLSDVLTGGLIGTIVGCL